MLEVEGYVEVCKGLGIYVIFNYLKYQQVVDESFEFVNYGFFELLQVWQLIESNIVEFVVIQVIKQDIMKLMEIQEKVCNEKCFCDFEWDLQFYVQVVLVMQNSVLVVIVEKMWIQCVYNFYWKKLYEYIDLCMVDNWCDDYD